MVVNEDEVGEYSDKHMGLWKKEQIPDFISETHKIKGFHFNGVAGGVAGGVSTSN